MDDDKSRIEGRTRMHVKASQVMRRCVEVGTAYGINCAFKHTDAPAREHLEDQVVEAVLNEIHEWFDFDSDQTSEKK